MQDTRSRQQFLTQASMVEYEKVTIVGQVPSKSNGYRIINTGGHASLKKSDALKRYETAFYMQMGVYRNLHIDGLFELHMDVYFTSMSHDLDNSLKVVLDSLQSGGAIKNDNRCTHIVARKFIDKTNPRIEFRLIEL